MSSIRVTVDNGWYSFSVSGHAYYSRGDEVKLHGKNAFVKYVKDFYKGNGPVCFNVHNVDQFTTKNVLINC